MSVRRYAIRTALSIAGGDRGGRTIATCPTLRDAFQHPAYSTHTTRIYRDVGGRYERLTLVEERELADLWAATHLFGGAAA